MDWIEILNFECRFWISEFGFWILDFGLWVLKLAIGIGFRMRNLTEPEFGIWNLEFGIGIGIGIAVKRVHEFNKNQSSVCAGERTVQRPTGPAVDWSLIDRLFTHGSGRRQGDRHLFVYTDRDQGEYKRPLSAQNGRTLGRADPHKRTNTTPLHHTQTNQWINQWINPSMNQWINVKQSTRRQGTPFENLT